MEKQEIENWIRQNETLGFARSGGPGGQYVNTSDTKVIIRLPVGSLPVSDQYKVQMLSRLENRLNAAGELVIHSSSSRSQARNRTDAEERALQLILSALKRRRKRRPTKPSRASRERRLASKKAHSRKKEHRKSPDNHPDQ